MVRSALANEGAIGMVREYLGRRVFGFITQALGVPDAQLRANLVGSQFIGLAILRYHVHLADRLGERRGAR